MINHAKQGLLYEFDFIKTNNLNKSLANPIWKYLNSKLKLNNSFENLYFIKTSRAYSSLHDNFINAKADTYLAYGLVPIEVLKSLDYTLDETIVEKYKLKKISFSGISIKKPDSKNYQILKISPKPFFNLFKFNDNDPLTLGAGASVYCKKESELQKNFPLILGWGSDVSKFKSYFKDIDNINLIDDPNTSTDLKLKVFKSIKNIATSRIKNIVIQNPNLLSAIFSGEGIFEEPYVAHYIFENNMITENIPKNFKVTTGSGRSKGNYQLEFKP